MYGTFGAVRSASRREVAVSVVPRKAERMSVPLFHTHDRCWLCGQHITGGLAHSGILSLADLQMASNSFPTKASDISYRSTRCTLYRPHLLLVHIHYRVSTLMRHEVDEAIVAWSFGMHLRMEGVKAMSKPGRKATGKLKAQRTTRSAEMIGVLWQA